MGWRLARWCLLGALGCGIAGPASAQELAPEVEARVNELRREAKELYDKRNPDAALERLRTAWEISKSYKDICNIGSTQMYFGRLREGATNLLKCKRMIPLAKRKELAGNVKEMENYFRIARERLGVLEVEANVPGAEIFIDGEMAGKLPSEDPIFVDPGWRIVEVRAAGFKSHSAKVDARNGTSVRLKMELEPLKPEVEPASKPERARERKTTAGNGSPGVSTSVSPKTHSPRTGPLVAGIALSVVGTAVGIGGLVAAKAAHADADAAGRKLDAMGVKDPCSGSINRELCKEYSSSVGQIAPFAGLGIGGLAVAGVGGAVILYELFGASPPNAKNSPRVALLVTPRGSALTVTGSF